MTLVKISWFETTRYTKVFVELAYEMEAQV